MARALVTALLVFLVGAAAWTCSGSVDIPVGDGGDGGDSDSDSDSDGGGCPGGCPPGQYCRDGRCVSSCSDDDDCTSPYQCCDGACVNVREDRSNCGSCGNDCEPYGDACVGGTCSCNGAVACAPPLICCGADGCIDSSSSSEHCGRCNSPCEGTCAGGSCEGCAEDAHEASGGDSCVDAFDMGELSDTDTGESQLVTGNLYPAGDQDCFWFTATDTPDTECDAFHVDIRLTENPGGVFVLQVYRGTCEAPECSSDVYDQYSWATDFLTGEGEASTGECPCREEPAEGANQCTDNSAVYRFCVLPAPGADPACEWYEVEASNGVYTSG